MTAAARHHVFTLTEYLLAEERSAVKHEFSEGQVLLMAGASPRHDYIETQALQVLGARLRGGPCFPMTSNRRIATPDGLYTYADGSVFCGEMAVEAGATATNPVVLVEVLSPSTRDYDRGEKLERYKTIPSLRHVLLVEQSAVDVEHWFKDGTEWRRRVHTALDETVQLSAIGVEFRVSDVYEGANRVPA